ncbi:MAG TPA: hypothetical protein VGE98_07910 [Thermoanaerobaculia bacterium]
MAKPGDRHPTQQLLERFMRNEADPAERRQVVRHLIAGCGRCLKVTRTYWSLGEASQAPVVALPADRAAGSDTDARPAAAFQEVFARLATEGRLRERRTRADQELAPQLLAELLALPAGDRLGRVYAEERFLSPALTQQLAERSLSLAEQEGSAEEALQSAELAVALAGQLDPALCGTSVVASLRARAWGCLGRARLAAADLPGADRALQTAEGLLSLHPVDPLVEAELYVHRAALEPEEGALHHLDRAAALYRSTNESRLLGRTLIRKGLLSARSEQGERRESAVDLLREGVALLDEGSDAPAAATALVELATLLSDLGRPEEAREAAAQARRFAEALGDVPALLRLRRFEGELGVADGEPAAAEAALVTVRDDLIESGLGRDAAKASLDLARLLANQGRGADLQRLAQGSAAIFGTRDVRKDTVVTLLVLRRASDREGATPELLSALSGFLASPPPRVSALR